MMKKGLGKGLGALIESESNDTNGIQELKINEIEPNLNQPRKHFDDEKLAQLADSIRQHGIVQPIIVKKEDGVYRIVAGERRWRAARIAGLIRVPVIIKEMTNKQVMEIALIENLQREDLNPIEEAEAFEKLMEEFTMTQEQISSTVGRSRSAIANSLRLLSLAEKVKGYVISGELSSGHARALIVIEDRELQQKTAEDVIKNKLTVRDTEKLVKKVLEKKPARKVKAPQEELLEIESRLQSAFGTKVKILSTNHKKGKIMIEYYSNDELDRILEMVDSMSKK